MRMFWAEALKGKAALVSVNVTKPARSFLAFMTNAYARNPRVRELSTLGAMVIVFVAEFRFVKGHDFVEDVALGVDADRLGE